MATHGVAWQENIDTATLFSINNVVDDVLTRSGTERYLVPPDYRFIHWVLASGPNLTRAAIVTPSLGVRRENYEIVPRRRGANTLSLLGPEIFKPTRPTELTGGEEIEAQAAEDAVGLSQANIIAALGPAELPPMPDGDIRRVRATASVTLTAFAWTSVSFTVDSTFEPGTYALVGFLPISANVLAARANIRGQQYRPVMPGFAGTEAAAVDHDPALWSMLMGYTMGSFTHITIPEIQFFSAVADTSETLFLYAIRTGAAPGGTPA